MRLPADYILFTVRLADGATLTRPIRNGQSFRDAFEDVADRLHPEARSRPGFVAGTVPVMGPRKESMPAWMTDSEP